MLFPTLEYVTRIFRELRDLPRVEVSDELRGWAWRDSPVASTQEALLGVSDITGGLCPTGRDVYLRYVLKVRPEDNWVLQKGRLIHEVYASLIEGVKRIVYSSGKGLDGDGLERELLKVRDEFMHQFRGRYALLRDDLYNWLFRRVWGEGVRTYAAALDSVRERSRFLSLDSIVSALVPAIAEFPLDGSLVGLSRSLRIDSLLLPSLLMEIKTRPPSRTFEAALAGYALAFESQYGIPVNHALLTYVNADVTRKEIYVYPKIVTVSDDLREDFLEMRDSRKESIAYGVDPGKATQCPVECPFRHYCLGEEGDG